MTWNNAKSLCETKGMSLPIVRNANENAQLLSKIGTTGRGIWLGLSDESMEGHWKWTDGSSMSYSNWSPGEPNGNRGENMGNMWKGTGKWNDNPAGDSSINVVCCPKSDEGMCYCLPCTHLVQPALPHCNMYSLRTPCFAYLVSVII